MEREHTPLHCVSAQPGAVCDDFERCPLIAPRTAPPHWCDRLTHRETSHERERLISLH
jgi:hypothetical protein